MSWSASRATAWAICSAFGVHQLFHHDQMMLPFAFSTTSFVITSPSLQIRLIVGFFRISS